MWALQVGQRWDEFSTEEQAQLASISFSLLQQGQSLKIVRMWAPSCRTDKMQAAWRPWFDDMHVVRSLQLEAAAQQLHCLRSVGLKLQPRRISLKIAFLPVQWLRRRLPLSFEARLLSLCLWWQSGEEQTPGRCCCPSC